MSRLTPLAKFLVIFLVIGGLAGLLFSLGVFDGSFKDKYTNKDNETDPIEYVSDPNSSSENTTGNVVKIGVVTWGGYAAGQYWNQGFKPNQNSRFRRDYGFDVEFKVLDDFNQSRQAWTADEVQLLWTTIDAFPTEAGTLQGNPKIVFQADWSRGGDAIVVRRGINSVADLKGKSVAVAIATPSHSFLINLINASNLTLKDLKIIEVASAIDAADMFKSNNVDCAVVWSPDDVACIEQVKGSKILTSTKTATNIIADGFFAKESWINDNKKVLQQLYEGWMKGAAELNSNKTARSQAAQILKDGLGVPLDWTVKSIDNVRLVTHGDNLNFFGLNRSFDGVTGQDLYQKMTGEYSKLGFVPKKTYWRQVNYTGAIESTNLSGSNHDPENTIKFKAPTKEESNAIAVATKAVRITFPTGKYNLDENSKYIIDAQFLDIAKQFANQRIRVEGNTDNTGSMSTNKRISLQRAQSVVDYLINEHGFDKNRFIIKGNGPSKPLASNSTKEGRSKNRRTDFELI